MSTGQQYHLVCFFCFTVAAVSLCDAPHEHEREGEVIAQGNNVLSKAQNLPKLTSVLSRKWSGSWYPSPAACGATWDHLVAPLSVYLLYLSCYEKDRSLPGAWWGLGKLLEHVEQQRHWKRLYLLTKSQVCLLDSSFQLSFRRQFKSQKVLQFLLLKNLCNF